MVDLDTLAALDALMWLRTGEEVCRRFGISPPKVSRLSRKCLDVFGVELERVKGEWHVLGDPTMLLLERRVHQTACAMDGASAPKIRGNLLVGPIALYACSR